MMQTRPLSRMCAAVSAPLPMWSSYSTVRPSTIRNDSIGPFGETLTCPPCSGAVPTKKSACSPIQSASFSSISAKSLPIVKRGYRSRDGGRYDDQTLSVQGSTATRTRRPQAAGEAQPASRPRPASPPASPSCSSLGVGLAFAGNANRLPRGRHDRRRRRRRDDARTRPGRCSRGRRERRAAVPVTFVAGSQSWQIQPSDLGVSEDWARAVDEAMEKGGGTSLVPRLPADRAALLPDGRRAQDLRVRQRGRVQGQPAREGRRQPAPRREDRAARAHVPARRGRDRAQSSTGTAAVDLVVAALAGSSREPVQLPVTIDPPKVTVADLGRVRARAARIVSAPITLKIGIANFVVAAAATRGDAARCRREARRSSRSAALPPNAYFGKLDRPGQLARQGRASSSSAATARSRSSRPRRASALDVPKTTANMLAAAAARGAARRPHRGRDGRIPSARRPRRRRWASRASSAPTRRSTAASRTASTTSSSSRS